MGGAIKVFSLLSSPLPLLYPRRASAFLRLSAAAFSSCRRGSHHLSCSPRRSNCTVGSLRQLQTQTLSSEASLHDSFNSQPEAVASTWPEWTRLVEWLTDEGYVDRARAALDGACEDGFVERGDLDLPEEFLRAGEALILFARENPDLLR